ncbi:MAG: preprotein translocase subunit SecE [Acidobacteria bacterium]|nr:preprotein translocase subunit SecE [Acidobacteriota bacterium]
MMAEALKVNNEESQISGRGPERPETVRQTPEWLQRLGEYPRRFKQFLHEVRVEMKQVTWPTVDDVKATTVVVILTVFFFGAFLAVVDYGAGWAVQRILQFFHK